MGKSKVAITYTVKNEKDTLFQNIAFHRKLGVTLFIVFFDKTTDESPKLISKFKDVIYRESVQPNDVSTKRLNVLPERFSKENLLEKHPNPNARRTYNVFWAAEKCIELGYDWLINIDPDELVIPNINSIKGSQLDDFLSQYNYGVRQVRFKTLECVPIKDEKSKHFSDVKYFVKHVKQNTLSTSESELVYEFLGKDFLYEPQLKEKIKLDRFFLGHMRGKTAMNLRFLDSYYPLAHEWVSNGKAELTPEIIIEGLYHFYGYNFNCFKNKFNNYRPMNSKSRRKRVALAMKNLVQNSSPEEIVEYYTTHFGRSTKPIPKEIEHLVVKPTIISKIYKTIPEEELNVE